MERSEFLVVVAVAVSVVALVMWGGLAGSAEADDDEDAFTVQTREQVSDDSVIQAAENLYNAEEVAVYPVNESRFQQEFPEHELYLVYDLVEHPAPAYTMALNDGEADQARDVTEDYNDILADDAVLIEDSEMALAYAEAFVQPANADLLPVVDRELVNSSDSERLNHSVRDPEVNSVAGDWEVKLSTYSPDNGIISRWTVTFSLTEIERAEADLQAVSTGPSNTTWQTELLNQDLYWVNDWNDGEYVGLTVYDTGEDKELKLLSEASPDWVVADEEESVDESVWQAKQDADADWTAEEQHLAENLTSAGAWAQEIFVMTSDACGTDVNEDAHFTFEQPDTDCTLEIKVLPDDVLHCAACLRLDEAANQNDLELLVDSDLHNWMTSTVGSEGEFLGLRAMEETTRHVVGYLNNVFFQAYENRSAVPEGDPVQISSKEDARDQMQEWAESRAIVGYNESLPDQEPEYVDEHDGEIVLENDGLAFHVVTTNTSSETQNLIDDARNRSDVDYATNDSVVETQAEGPGPNSRYPDDPLYQASQQWGTSAIGLPKAWEQELGDQSVDLHIHDTGIDYLHHDLIENLDLAEGYFADCDAPPRGESWATAWTPEPFGKYAQTDEGYENQLHGTMMAGTVGGVINNTAGVAGASQVCMTSARTISTVCCGMLSWHADALHWSADNGADIILQAVGEMRDNSKRETPQVIQDAANYAARQDVVLIGAAGNNECDWRGPETPARAEEVIAVGALMDETTRAEYSACQRDSDLPGSGTLELMAPGSGLWGDCDPYPQECSRYIWSTRPFNLYGHGNDDDHRSLSYYSMGGTSFSAAYTAGTAALVLSQNTTLMDESSETKDTVDCILRSTADDIGSREKYGYGRVNATASVDAAEDPGSVGC
jgi:subtilisin family serine protease